MAFKCGHCKGRHDTIAEGRECAAKKQQGKDLSKFLQKAINEERYSALTSNTQKYLSDLLNHFSLVLVGDQTVETIDYSAGKKILNGLIDARRLQATSKPFTLPDGVLHDPTASRLSGERGPTPQQLPDCPSGHYAVPSMTGNNDLDFFRVDKPADGQYAGRTFVKRIIGGHPDSTVRGKTAREAIEAILNIGPEDAGILYGTKLGRCMRCNRHLTDELSRALGIGPECRSKS